MRRSRRKQSTLLSALILEIATLLAIVTVAQPTAVMHFFENVVRGRTAPEAPSTADSVTPIDHIASSNAPHFLDHALAWPPPSGRDSPVLPPQADLPYVPNYR